MSETELPHKKEYREYLIRAEKELGSVAVGQYAKWSGQLVQKLSHREFVERYDRYLEIRRTYDEILRQGDTVNDAVVQLLNEHAAQLLLKL
jgi:hypothetical protein